MSRRALSPLRMNKSDTDPRDNMIRKLKDDLIVARGREKELVILEHYLLEISEKTKIMEAECAKTDEEGKLKLELAMKTINELKKEVDILRNQLRNTHTELKGLEDEEGELKKLLNGKIIEIEKLKKEGAFVHSENEKSLDDHYKLRAQEDEMTHDIRKTSETIRDLEARITQVNRKVVEVKSFIAEITQVNQVFKEKLKAYQKKNNGIGSDLDEKEMKIDALGKIFAEKHEQIKTEVERYIEMEHENEKNMKEAHHKTNLVKIETEKCNQLTGFVKKLQKTIVEQEKKTDEIHKESGQIQRIIEVLASQNQQMKNDLGRCQEHFQNLMRHNCFIQEQMEKIVRDDEAIINVIRKKKLLPSIENFQSLRSSRGADYRNTPRAMVD